MVRGSGKWVTCCFRSGDTCPGSGLRRSGWGRLYGTCPGAPPCSPTGFPYGRNEVGAKLSAAAPRQARPWRWAGVCVVWVRRVQREGAVLFGWAVGSGEHSCLTAPLNAFRTTGVGCPSSTGAGPGAG